MGHLISVIIPVYNMEKYLKRCVDSIIAQDYENLQIILVNDGSKDNSIKIIRDYEKKDNRIVVVDKENGGLSSARNAGLEVATGEYVGFVDSDDYVELDMVSSLYNAIAKSQKGLANTSFVRAFENGQNYESNVPHKNQESITATQYLGELLMHVGDVSVCTKLFPREVLQDIRFEEGTLNEDLLFMLQVIPKIEKINYVGKVGYYYFVREGSISSKYGKAVIDMQKNSLTKIFLN